MLCAKSIRTTLAKLAQCTVLLAWEIGAVQAAAADSEQDAAIDDAGAGSLGPKLGLALHLDTEYTSNLFRYPNRRIADFAAGNVDIAANERFYRLKGPEDVVTTPGSDVLVTWKRSNKRETELSIGAGYAIHARNPIANYLILDAEAAYDLTKRDTLSFETEFIPSRFKKNYQLNSGDYARADYLRWGANVGYEHGWSDRWRTAVGVGFAMRRFDAPFTNRNENTYTGDLRIEYDPWKRWTFGASVEVGRTLTPDGVEIDVRVDRSHLDVEPGLSATLDLPSRWDVEAGVAYRWRSYTTDEGNDGVHFERLDRRLTLEGEIGKGFGRAFSLSLGASYADSDSGRFDPNDDPDDFGYDELRLGLGAEYVF